MFTEKQQTKIFRKGTRSSKAEKPNCFIITYCSFSPFLITGVTSRLCQSPFPPSISIPKGKKDKSIWV